MRTTRRSSTAQHIGTATSERRTHQRLRDLCDEVLWSFRIASDRDLISDQERLEARALLSNMALLGR